MRVRLLLLLLLLLPAACTGVAPQRTVPPEVRLVDLVPAQLGIFEQKLEARLRVVNPDTVPLKARGIRFTMEVEGTPFGRGLGDARFSVPALGETVITVPLYASTTALVERILQLASGRGVTYRLAGDILVAQGGALPFETEAALRLPGTS